MAVFTPRDDEIALISLNTNMDGGGEGLWFNGDGADGFLKNFFADSVFFGIREGKTGIFAFVPNNATASTPLTTASMDEILARGWYLNQFGGNFICQSHLARAAAPYTATAAAAYSAAEDAKVWSAAKVTNARAIIRKLADHCPSASGKSGIRIWLGPNEGDLNPDDIARGDTDRQAAAIARFVQLDRARWEELRGPDAPFKHPGILCTTTMSAQALRGDAGGTFRSPAYLTYNNGEVLNYIDAVACTNHHRNMAHEDGPGLVGAAPKGGINSFYWLWKAIKAAQAAYGAGAPLVPVLCTEWGGGLKAGNYVGTPTGDWLTDDLTLNGKNVLRTYRMGLAVNAFFYWGISAGCYYSLAFSPAELATGAGTELERSRGTNGTQNLFYTSGSSALVGHQPVRDFFARVMDMRRYLLPPGGVIPIPTKTWQLDTADLDNGFHVPYTWAVCATAYNAPDGGSLNVQPWKQWLAVTFPGGGEIVSSEQASTQKVICRPVFLPRHTSWTAKADIMCTGGGLARLAVRGYDLLDGEALTISPNATSEYSTVSVTFRPRGHNLRLPNAARAVVVLHHNGVGTAKFKNVAVFPTGTAAPDTGGDPLAASASAAPATGAAPLSVTFTGDATGGTRPRAYSWDFGDGSAPSTAQNPTHTYAIGGTYTATVTVTDAAMAVSTASVTVTATTASLAATVAASPASGDAPLTVAFTGGATGGTGPYTYAWAFGDGGTSALQNPTHTYSGAGTYTARLTVTDSTSAQAAATVAITATAASTDACSGSTTDLFRNPCNAASAQKRPIGSGATYGGASHAWTVAWLRGGIAAPLLNVNAPSGGWSPGMWDCTDPSKTVQVTVRANEKASAATIARLPINIRVPIGFDASFNGPKGLDNPAIFWDGTGFYDFHYFWTVTKNSEYTTGAYPGFHAGGGQGHGGSPRGSSAAGLWFEAMVIRGHVWNDPDVECETMLGIALGAKTTHPVGAQIGKTFIWPASSGDNSMAANDGVIPYGAIFAIPPPEKGGPNPASLNLGAANSIKARLYRQAVKRGWVVIDKADNPVFRADQTLTEANRLAIRAAARELYPYLRPVTNVGATGSNPIGGGSPLAPNCAFNRQATVAIKSVAYWESQGSAAMASDLSVAQPLSLSTNSYNYYSLAYYLNGHVAMYRATGLTKYLDRALLYTNNMISKATTQAGGYLGWKSVEDGNNETSLREIYPWRYVCQLIDAMADAGVTGSYLTQYNSILAFTETNIFSKWYSRGVNSNMYRSVLHICSHWANIADTLVRRSANATIVANARTVRDNIDHVGMPNWNGDSIRSRIVAHPVVSTANYWQAYFPNVAGGGTAPGIPSTDTSYGSDTNHGSDVLSWIVEAYDRGYGPWTASDISKFLSLINDVIWVGSTHYGYLRGFIEGNSLRADGNYNTGFLKLGRYSRTFQVRLEGLAIAQNMGRYGNMALNAKILGG